VSLDAETWSDLILPQEKDPKWGLYGDDFKPPYILDLSTRSFPIIIGHLPEIKHSSKVFLKMISSTMCINIIDKNKYTYFCK